MSQKQQNRSMFPTAALVVDAFRDVFGPSVKLTYASEGGNTVGNPLDERLYRVVSLSDVVIAPRADK